MTRARFVTASDANTNGVIDTCECAVHDVICDGDTNAARSIAAAAAPKTGTWANTGVFVTEDMSSESPLSPSATQGAGYYQYAAVADDLAGATGAKTGHLLTFPTGSAGDLTLEGVLSSVDYLTSTWTDRPVSVTHTVE